MGNEKSNLGDLLSLIKYPLLTEKAINLYSKQQYTFIVDKSLTKTEIKYILEKIFNISIVSVNTCILPIKKRKVGRFLGNRSQYKKTYVKLKEGDSISDLFN
jgi:large subunit ribosomal protein L23